MKINETANIIAPRNSPLFLQAVCRNVLCHVFQHNYIPNEQNALLWDPDIKKTAIIIELDNNDNLEVRQKRPAIIITSMGTSINDQVGVGHSRARNSFMEGLESHYTLSQTGIVLNVDSCVMEESKALAFIVSAILTTAHQKIRQIFDIHSIEPLMIEPTVEINIGEGYYRTRIVFNVVMDFVWNRAKLDFPVEAITANIDYAK